MSAMSLQWPGGSIIQSIGRPVDLPPSLCVFLVVTTKHKVYIVLFFFVVPSLLVLLTGCNHENVCAVTWFNSNLIAPSGPTHPTSAYERCHETSVLYDNRVKQFVIFALFANITEDRTKKRRVPRVQRRLHCLTISDPKRRKDDGVKGMYLVHLWTTNVITSFLVFEPVFSYEIQMRSLVLRWNLFVQLWTTYVGSAFMVLRWYPVVQLWITIVSSAVLVLRCIPFFSYELQI